MVQPEIEVLHVIVTNHTDTDPWVTKLTSPE